MLRKRFHSASAMKKIYPLIGMGTAKANNQLKNEGNIEKRVYTSLRREKMRDKSFKLKFEKNS